MSTKLYMFILGGVSAGFVLCVGVLAGFKLFSLHQPERPARMPATAVWRPTPAENVPLLPHGDWVACWNEGSHDHCVVTDAGGELEYEGAFSPLPEGKPLPGPRQLPVVSDTISPWMWSNRANRQVPVIQMEDGTVLAPTESAADLRSYVDRVEKFSAREIPAPVHFEYHAPESALPSQNRQ